MPSVVFVEPDMSYYDSTEDSIRRLTDDYGRHKLSDLMEADENEEDDLDYLRSSSRRKRYSSIGSTASSIDGLWELHPRRLSEAGLSRHSDSSAVLTEDTDSFIIGQRVWVGGTKPGTIAYIGETQFAPGDWAGIALDEPIGKNDGSVSGIRYFQCENKKGVFSRLTRLTRVPLEQPGMGSNETFTTSPSNGVRRSPISPTGSTRCLLKSPTLTNSNTSLSSAHVDFKIGDRVIIKSTQGSKVGTVRYMGLTDFAPGEWVGVELDDPRGKNDGSVEGKRYFECRPNFGLFAPISKVSKSPSKYKPGACVVHSGTGLPPSGMKRTNSKESMTSLASKTSAASSVRRKVPSQTTSTPIPTRTALQDVLREKQQHIEQLLKERDLERSEITRAASQADEAEHKFFALKQEFEQYRAECESRLKENIELLSQLKADRTDLLTQLEDEKRKNEDLLFRFEEAAITKCDVEATNESFVKKIKDLEKCLANERQKSENVEGISNKLFEAEESLIKAREETETVKSELEEIRKNKEVVEGENTKSAELVNTLKNQIDGILNETKEKDKIINTLKDNITNITSQYEVLKKQLEEDNIKLNENSTKRDKQMEELSHNLSNKEATIKEILVKIEKLEIQNTDLSKENDKLKMEVSAKSLDLETTLEKLTLRENEFKSVESLLQEEKAHIKNAQEELARYRDNSNDVETNLRKELEETRENLRSRISEIENIKKEFSLQASQKDLQLEESKKEITQSKNTINKLNDDLADVKNKFEEYKTEINNRYTQQVADRDLQLSTLSSEMHVKTEEITKLQNMITKLEEDISMKNGNIEKLRLELESHQREQAVNVENLKVNQEKLHQLELTNGDLQRKLQTSQERITELTESNKKLETEIQNIITKSGAEEAHQIEDLRKTIQEKEHSIENIKSEYSEKLQNAERKKQELEIKYEQLATDSEKLQEELENKLQVSLRSEVLLEERCANSLAEIAKVRDEYTSKIGELERLLQEKETTLIRLNNKCFENESISQEKIKTLTEEMNHNLQSCQEQINNLTQESKELKQQLTAKSEEVIEINSKYSHIMATSEQNEKELQQKYEENIRRLEHEVTQKSNQLESTVNQLESLKNDIQNTESDLSEKNKKINELNTEVQNKQTVINELQDQLNSLESEKQVRVKEHEENVKRLENEISQKIVQLETTTNELTLLKSDCQSAGTDLSEKNKKIEDLNTEVQSKQTVINDLQEKLNSVMSEKQVKSKEYEETQSQCKSLSEQISTLNEKLNADKSILENLKIEKANVMQIIGCLKITKDQKQQLENEIGNSKNNGQLKDLLGHLKIVEIKDAENVLMLQRELEFVKNQLMESTRHFELQKQEIQRLQNELVKAQETIGKGAGEQLIEDRELADNQIRFLNSIIVDIQKKNEEQKARIEILESGSRTAFEDELKSLGLPRQVPPRVYCDICEEFDLHETEDCPQQNTDVDQMNSSQGNKKQVEERPYCEICEVFGHATENCQDDQTF